MSGRREISIAILFTGRISSTARLQRENLVGCNGRVNIFYYLEQAGGEAQGSEAQGGEAQGDEAHGSEAGVDLSHILGVPPSSCRGEVVRNSRNDSAYRAILDYVMTNAPALRPEVLERERFDREFFYRAGAILEYYQFMKAYEHMLDYERSEGVTFDVVVRSRLDVVLREPLRIRDFFERINEPLLHEFGPQVYIQSLGCMAMAERIRAGEVVPLFEYRNALFDGGGGGMPLDSQLVMSQILNDKIMWTMYCNWIWVARRHTMDLMPHFVYRYGALVVPRAHHCFNSENQFYLHLVHHNVKLAYYFTRKEWDLWDRHELQGHPIVDRETGQWISDSDALVAIVRRVG